MSSAFARSCIRRAKGLLSGKNPCAGPGRVYCSAGNEIHGIEYQPAGDAFATLAVPAAAGHEATAAAPAAMLLARTDYLLKVIEVPAVAAEEVSGLLNLEVEALLPGDFGAFELSFFPLACPKAGVAKYEVCIAAGQVLQDGMDRLRQAGAGVQAVLPTAVAWRGFFNANSQVDIAIAAVGPGVMEIAARHSDDSLFIRSVAGDAASGAPGQGLMSSLSPLLDMVHKDGKQPSVCWVGRRLAELSLPDVGVVELGAGACDWPLLALAAQSPQSLRAGYDLMPASMVAGRAWQAQRRRMFKASAMVAAGLLLFLVAIKVATARIDGAIDRLDAKIATIKSEGETVGRAVEHLTAVDAAKATQGDFAEIISGLLEATPEGITYSQVDLRSSGELVLRGSSASLSSAFQLPEALEKQSVFTQVMLRDAGQTKSAGGVSAEFDIQCSLSRHATK